MRMTPQKNKSRRRDHGEKSRTKNKTLYNVARLESRLEQIPESFRSLFKNAYISTRKLCMKSQSENAPEGLFELIDRLCDAKIESLQPACASGCAWCCQQDVLIAPFEFATIRDAIDNANLTQIIRDKLKNRTDEAYIETEGARMPVSPCPLLENDRCLIYPARPIACRTQFSMDSGQCHRAYEAARTGGGDSTYQRLGEPAVIGIAAREAIQTGKRIFLRQALRDHLT
ncbi:MAG: hypothetical protein DHS20C01_14800 [marine bacterium B5-7]|nr:MAG: hypothetical protein DHS20C01_14800 [marine bacterium B5-7]